MRLRHPLLGIITAVLFGIALAAPALGENDDFPVVVVRVDDCLASWETPRAALDGKSPLDYAKQNKIPITWAIVVDSCDRGSAIAWGHIKDYLDYAGGEPASHSYHHSSVSSAEQAAAELASSKAAIEARIPGYLCTSFIQPGGWRGDAYLATYAQFDNPLGRALVSTYDQSMAYVTDGAAAGNVYYRQAMCCQFSLDSRYTNWTPEAATATLDALTNCPGTMFVFQLHSVGGNPLKSICIDEASYKAFIDKLVQLRSAAKIHILSFRDACARTVSATINHAPDPGFESTTLGTLNPRGPWIRTYDTKIVANGGVGNSRCAKLPYDRSTLQSCLLALAPGRYELSWHQRPEPASPNSSGLVVDLTLNGAGPLVHTVNSLHFSNVDRAAWERKSVLLLIPENMPTAQIRFQPGSHEVFGVDDVSLVASPLDPAVSPTNLRAVPGRGQCTLSWNTPTDPAVTSVRLQYSTACWPVAADDGIALATVAAIPGAHQEVIAPIDWPGAPIVYFSAFAVTSTGSSTPDFAYVSCDTTPPLSQPPAVTVQSSGTVEAYEQSIDNESPVTLYRFAVGTSRGADDVAPWISSTEPRKTFSGLPGDKMLWVSAQSENMFGFETSVITSGSFSAGGIEAAARHEDNALVTVCGLVSAVFGDCCYMEEADRSRGIRVNGQHSVRQGDTLAVSGSITTTAAGERAIVPD